LLQLVSFQALARDLAIGNRRLEKIFTARWHARKPVALSRCLVSLSSYDLAAGGNTGGRVGWAGLIRPTSRVEIETMQPAAS
jgi:hypothetical protein